MKEKLEARKARMVDYMLLKIEEEDWHAVSDAANDVREIDAKLELLAELEPTITFYSNGTAQEFPPGTRIAHE